MKRTTILIPTCDRPEAIMATLISLYHQKEQSFDIVISDQSTMVDLTQHLVMQSLQRLFHEKEISLKVVRHQPRQGMAEQRQFLLDQVHTPYCLFLDDDVILESFVLKNLLTVISAEECGFTGNAVIGLRFRHDIRLHEQQIEFWGDKVLPENIVPDSLEWNRHKLHNAANVLHVQKRLSIRDIKPLAYKIAWVGGCVLYDTEKLRKAGGYGFWTQLPVNHCGEDVMAQLSVMRLFGGCGVLPSGAYHLELPTTVPDRFINAPEYLIT